MLEDTDILKSACLAWRRTLPTSFRHVTNCAMKQLGCCTAPHPSPPTQLASVNISRPNKVGHVKASCIRKLTFGVPESLNPDTALPNFLYLFCDLKPNLKTLDFTTRFQIFAIIGNDLNGGRSPLHGSKNSARC
jgi:hypothetical protein